MDSKKNSLLRVTIDTNLIVSGTISPNSIPSKLVTSWINGEFIWVQTQETFNELAEVLNRSSIKTKYHLNSKDIQDFLENLSIGVEFVKPMMEEDLPIHSRDVKDDILLACALGGNCDFLITGDKDLLVLNTQKNLRKLQIIKVTDFLQRKK